MLTDNAYQTEMALNAINQLEKLFLLGSEASELYALQSYTAKLFRDSNFSREVVRDFVFVTNRMIAKAPKPSEVADA